MGCNVIKVDHICCNCKFPISPKESTSVRLAFGVIFFLTYVLISLIWFALVDDEVDTSVVQQEGTEDNSPDSDERSRIEVTAVILIDVQTLSSIYLNTCELFLWLGRRWRVWSWRCEKEKERKKEKSQRGK